jgi:hypothetical protein
MEEREDEQQHHHQQQKRHPLEKMKKTFYSSLKKKDLAKLLRDLTLPTNGSETDLKKRHENFCMCWNAFCDEIIDPPTPEHVIQSFKAMENTKNQAAFSALLKNANQKKHQNDDYTEEELTESEKVAHTIRDSIARSSAKWSDAFSLSILAFQKHPIVKQETFVETLRERASKVHIFNVDPETKQKLWKDDGYNQNIQTLLPEECLSALKKIHSATAETENSNNISASKESQTVGATNDLEQKSATIDASNRLQSTVGSPETFSAFSAEKSYVEVDEIPRTPIKTKSPPPKPSAPTSAHSSNIHEMNLWNQSKGWTSQSLVTIGRIQDSTLSGAVESTATDTSEVEMPGCSVNIVTATKHSSTKKVRPPLESRSLYSGAFQSPATNSATKKRKNAEASRNVPQSKADYNKKKCPLNAVQYTKTKKIRGTFSNKPWTCQVCTYYMKVDPFVKVCTMCGAEKGKTFEQLLSDKSTAASPERSASIGNSSDSPIELC